jgi:DNA ligase (NAD+)
LGRIDHFICRKAMNIDGLGEETVELLYRNGLIHDIADLYALRVDQLATLPRLGDRSAENIVESVRRSLTVPFARVLFALGIRFVGETTAKELASHFGSLDALMQASRETLIEVDEVGPKVADAIIDYFADPVNQIIIQRLRHAGVQFCATAQQQQSDVLSGKNFVISGKFHLRSRDELKSLIEQHGGRNLAAVSSNVDYLIAGDNMGPAKLKKAERLGIAFLTEQEFLAMIADAPLPDVASQPQPQSQPQREPELSLFDTPTPDTPTTSDVAEHSAQPLQGTLF